MEHSVENVLSYTVWRNAIVYFDFVKSKVWNKEIFLA